MNIISSSSSKNVVSLEELVPQHDCLKLLILHTPYTLVIDTLHLCVNLIKLDLSKNNLESFPHLGELVNLKFMFIHENRLDVLELKNIFQQNQQKSKLSQNIVWVTYWGNKNAFLGRHYLANQTSAIAVDKNLIVYEERCLGLPYFCSEQPFGPATDISYFLRKRNVVNRHASEQEYMNQLWIQLRQLRKKYEELLPVITIQKWVRGWLVRNTVQKANKKLRESQNLKQRVFRSWREQFIRQKKLKAILKGVGKQYLLIKGKQGRMKEINYKMKKWAYEAKNRVLSKKYTLSKQIKFYEALRRNFLTLKSLYDVLLLERVPSLYISRNSWIVFQKYVIPFAESFTKQKIVRQVNKQYVLHCLYQFSNDRCKQFIKILNTNLKSVVFRINPNKTINNRSKRRKNSLIYGLNLKSIYKPIHISSVKKESIEAKLSRIDQNVMYSLEQLIKIEGDSRSMKDIVRGIYFYNSGVLKVQRQDGQRIQFLSGGMIERITSVIKIQKVWRGYLVRKKNKNHLKVIIKMQRAAIIIQRWYRRLYNIKKKLFLIQITKELSTMHDKIFYIETNDYLNLLEQQKNKNLIIKGTLKLMEQNCRIYMNKESNVLSYCWDCESSQRSVIQNIRIGKIIFSKRFFNQQIGLSDEQIDAKLKYDRSKHILLDMPNLFHFGTESSLVKKNKSNFLLVKCNTKAEAKFRYFILKLILFTFKKDEKRIKIFTSQNFGSKNGYQKIEIGKQGSVFMSNQNIQLIKICEDNIGKDTTVSLNIVNNKFYLQNGEKKPIKTQQKMFIFMINNQQQTQQNEEIIKQTRNGFQRRYKTQISYVQDRLSSQMVVDIKQEEKQDIEGLNNQNKLRQVIQKRSMKQFKIDKRLKNRKQHPSFILDSVSINDRLTTQADVLLTQVSQPQINIINKSHQKQKSSEIQFVSKQSEKKKHRMYYLERRNESFKRKQDQNFIKRFVNIGNFIQNQFANDHRRRIKTQVENGAIQLAQNVKKSLERSKSHRVQQIQQKFKATREKHSQHRQLVNKNQISLKEQSLKMKNDIFEQRQKKLQDKAKLKRLKVTFAEQCYPLANKTKKTEYFP